MKQKSIINKRNLALIPLLGAIGLVSIASVAYASEIDGANLNQSNEDRPAHHTIHDNAKDGDNHSMKKGRHMRFDKEQIEAIKITVESNDFEAFKSIMEENRPEGTELNEEHLEKMEMHFEKMSEHFQNGEPIMKHRGEKPQHDKNMGSREQ